MLVLGAQDVAGAEVASEEAVPAPSTSTAVVTRNLCDSTIEPSAIPPETAGLGVAIVLDEHLLTNATRDQDYNGGGEVTLSGDARGGFLGRGLDRALGLIDELSCPASRFAMQGWQSAHAFASGLLVFTPRDLSAHEIIHGDRPYASLFFVSAGRRHFSSNADVAYDSSLTLGIMGLAAARDVQSALHDVTGSVQPEGWSHQVSAGGEPTARYSSARQALLADYKTGALNGDSKWTLAGSVGTVTEASAALGARWGRIESPWWAFTPEENTYVQETQPIAPPLPANAPAEIFAFAGARLKLRVYNAFLQGQFRHSDLSYREGDLNQLLGEAWAGVQFRTASGWALQYLARWQSPELRSGIGSRSILWGSIQVSKTFDP
jgi:hypothetical protein